MTQQLPRLSTREPFAVQAAKFSLYGPIVLIVVNLSLQGVLKGQASGGDEGMLRLANLIEGIISLAVLVAGFVLGIVALTGMRQHGTKGILGRAVAGVALNGLFLVGSVVVLITVMGIAGRLREPVDHSLSTAGYVSKGVPSPAMPWSAAEYKKATAALQVLAAGDANSLPRWKSPTSGEMFARMCTKENIAALGEDGGDVSARLAPEGRIAQQLEPLMQNYVKAQGRGAKYYDEMTEITRFGLELCVQMDRDLDALLATIPSNRPEHELVAQQVVKARSGLAMAVEGGVEMLGERKGVRVETLARLAGYEREQFPHLMHAVPAAKARELIGKVQDYRDRETDATYKAALNDLQAAMAGAVK